MNISQEKYIPIILAVDDNILNLQIIGNVISNAIPCDIRIARSGLEALEQIENIIPDLILLDINMPEMDGYTVCRKIKSKEALKDTPVIFITALGDIDSIVRGFEAGGSDYVVKPFDPHELIARARTHLELRYSRLKLTLINKELKERNDIMEKELRIAQKVMSNLISMNVPKFVGMNVDFRYIPLDKVGGDYFRFFAMPKGQCAVFLGDVTGHGVSAALFISLIKAVTDRIQADKGHIPVEFMRTLNQELIGKLTSYFIASLYLYFLHLGEGSFELHFVTAGNPKPILIRNGEASFLGQNNTVVGIHKGADYQQDNVFLKKGDRIFIYTDGIPETRNAHNKIIGFSDDLLNLFVRSDKGKLGDTLNAIIEELTLFQGHSKAEDDITIIGFEIL